MNLLLLAVTIFWVFPVAAQTGAGAGANTDVPIGADAWVPAGAHAAAPAAGVDTSFKFGGGALSDLVAFLYPI